MHSTSTKLPLKRGEKKNRTTHTMVCCLLKAPMMLGEDGVICSVSSALRLPLALLPPPTALYWLQ